MDGVKAAFCEPSSTQAKLLLKGLSLSAGVFLVLAGLLGGCSTPFKGGGLVYFIGAVYAVLFGLVVMTVELKDKNKFISSFYLWIDTYLKFLTLQVAFAYPTPVVLVMLEHCIVQQRAVTFRAEGERRILPWGWLASGVHVANNWGDWRQ